MIKVIFLGGILLSAIFLGILKTIGIIILLAIVAWIINL